MNFGVGGNHSVILMSVRPNAPYRDRIEDGGTALIYAGHDQPRRPRRSDPKLVDQLGMPRDSASDAIAKKDANV